MIKDWKKDLFTIPNLLSLFRLLLIPVYVIIYLNARDAADYYIAAGILAVSCLTDLIDGKIARHFNMISNVGKILDPVADKLTQLTLIICLSVHYSAVRSVLILFVIKESFQTIAGFLLLRKGKMLAGALITGKICTTVLFISLILLVMLPGLSQNMIHWLTGVDIAFMLIAFGDYVRVYCKKGPMIQTIENPNE
jgi:cardiolipin synthase